MTMDRVLGIAALVLGTLGAVNYAALIVRGRMPMGFWKLEPMQRFWGRVPGTLIHFASYVLLPLALGVLLLWQGG